MKRGRFRYFFTGVFWTIVDLKRRIICQNQHHLEKANVVTTGGCGGGSASWSLVNLGVNNDGKSITIFAIIGNMIVWLRKEKYRHLGEIGRKRVTCKKFSVEYGKLFGHTGWRSLRDWVTVLLNDWLHYYIYIKFRSYRSSGVQTLLSYWHGGKIADDGFLREDKPGFWCQRPLPCGPEGVSNWFFSRLRREIFQIYTNHSNHFSICYLLDL